MLTGVRHSRRSTLLYLLQNMPLQDPSRAEAWYRMSLRCASAPSSAYPRCPYGTRAQSNAPRVIEAIAAEEMMTESSSSMSCSNSVRQTWTCEFHRISNLDLTPALVHCCASVCSWTLARTARTGWPLYCTISGMHRICPRQSGVVSSRQVHPLQPSHDIEDVRTAIVLMRSSGWLKLLSTRLCSTGVTK